MAAERDHDDLVEDEGVNAASTTPAGGTRAGGRHDAPPDGEGEQPDGTGNGSELTSAGGEDPGPGQELSAGEG